LSEPKCPSCGNEGISNIVSTASDQESKGGDAWFEDIYCEKCGHVYGVFAKHILSHEIKHPVLPPSITI
jgi:uncharacterized Zn finger protein